MKTFIEQPKVGTLGTTAPLMSGKRYRLNMAEFLETFPSWSISAWEASDNSFDIIGNQRVSTTTIVPGIPAAAKTFKMFSFCLPSLSVAQQALYGIGAHDPRARAQVHTAITHVVCPDTCHKSMRVGGPAFCWPFYATVCMCMMVHI
jgi:hypothetical protein